MLRIVLGYRSGSLTQDPVVLYCGHSGSKTQDAIDAAKKFARLETAEIPVTRRAKRSLAVIEQANQESLRRAEKKCEKLAEARAAKLSAVLLEGDMLPIGIGLMSDEEFLKLLEEATVRFNESEEARATEKLRSEKIQTARASALGVYSSDVPSDLCSLSEEEFADLLTKAVAKFSKPARIPNESESSNETQSQQPEQ